MCDPRFISKNWCFCSVRAYYDYLKLFQAISLENFKSHTHKL
ncbi:hypothetical protein EU95_0021 [Prochlorococcus marinus str. MIT 9201]|uniref:Uncharacterized protein n=1 Tax=Prochlorococcus marinus str. MIT 9201 TaxID=93057 RepID=A0A0A2AB98_PROMR|nr:hypothetical protein EU95_0021 [Prochlorococcus marinus str. MIT 9201]